MSAEIDQMIRRHQQWSGVSAAFLYAMCAAVAVNVFQIPGGIYSGGVTGFAQLIAKMVSNWLNFTILTPFGELGTTSIFSVGILVVLMNVPLMILAWRCIGHRFTLYTILSVGLSGILMQIIPVHPLTTDPIICGIMGSIIGGFGTGFALRSNISTGGVDIIMLLIRKKMGVTIGNVNIAVNGAIVLIAGFLYGWPQALISALCIFIGSRIIDSQYTRQQRLQALVVCVRPERVIRELQENLNHSVTLIHGGEGGYDRKRKTVLLAVISRAEYFDFIAALKRADGSAFASVTPVDYIVGTFFEPDVL